MCSQTTTRTRKPLTEAHGTCQWIEPAKNGNRQLIVNGVLYELEDLQGRGYRLYRLKDGAVVAYDIDTRTPHGWTCDCPDATYRPDRPGGCKHVRALQAALAVLTPVAA